MKIFCPFTASTLWELAVYKPGVKSKKEDFR